MKVPIDQIKPSPNEFRDTYGQEDFEELKQQAEVGLIYPLLVRPLDGEYEIVDGHRRLAALKAAGAKEVPVAIYEADDYELVSIAVEMGVRPHSAVEKGELVWKWLVEQLGLTGEAKTPDPYGFIHSYRLHESWADLNEQCGDLIGQLEVRFGSLRSVENWLSAYKQIAPPVREMLSKGEITSSQARHVAEGLPGRPELQERVAKKIAEEGIGGSQAVGRLTKVVRTVEEKPEVLEKVLEVPWTKSDEELVEEGEIEVIVERLEAKEEEEKERAWWSEHPATKEFLEMLKRHMRLLKRGHESIVGEKIPAEHCNYLAEFMESKVRGLHEEVIADLREKAGKWQ